jgi:hypothetical protein
MTDPATVARYASYANHCAIQRKVPLTLLSWKKAGEPKP